MLRHSRGVGSDDQLSPGGSNGVSPQQSEQNLTEGAVSVFVHVRELHVCVHVAASCVALCVCTSCQCALA